MSNSKLSLVSTQSFRDKLLTKNLPSYKVPGTFSTSPLIQKDFTQNISNVKDSPNDVIGLDIYAKDNKLLNKFSPPNGYDISSWTYYNRNANVSTTNLGLYLPGQETRLDLVNEFRIDLAYDANIYGPIGGYNSMVTITDLQINDRILEPYWEPLSFVPSRYSPFSIVTSSNQGGIVGTNGSLSDDSFIAKIGAERLKFSFKERIAYETQQNLNTDLTVLNDPLQASLLASGKKNLKPLNYKITVSDSTTPNNNLLSAISGSYYPSSPIPGDYFDETISGNELFKFKYSQGTSTLSQLATGSIGSLVGPFINKLKSPSQLFLNNTGDGQRSSLFDNIDYNRFQPIYERNYGGRTVDKISNIFENAGYYIGSRNSDPGMITSPPNQVPTDEYGRQVKTDVYGPSELGILYEGNQNKLNFGLNGRATIDGGSIDGGFVWVSQRTKDSAGQRATIDGGPGKLDEQFNQISSNYEKNLSTNIAFKGGSILDETQRLVNSSDNVSGIQRLKHVGNAINQVSKVFHDGYKVITKGSKVLSYVDNTTGKEKGVEYCRLFTKDTPYYTFSDLQKSDGITKEGRRFSYSVLDSTYNLNIAPMRGKNSTNIVKNSKGKFFPKKYMFSIENLAWRTSSRPGFTVDDLPVCEQGPNGGRIMWFPPYDLKFDDSSSANFNKQDILGRPEPMFTYKNTTRSGSLNWKIIVDSPSVLNLLVDKQLKGLSNEEVDSILKSFFAGCAKFDIYKLAELYSSFSVTELQEIQRALNEERLTDEESKNLLNQIPSSEPKDKKEVDQSISDYQTKYVDYGFYFDKDLPNSGTDDFISLFNNYVSDSNVLTYKQNSQQYFGNGQQSETFFNNVIRQNKEFLTDGNDSIISKTKEVLDKGNVKVTIEISNSTSVEGNDSYNNDLANKRYQVIQNYFKNSSLSDYITNGKLFINNKGRSQVSTPKGGGTSQSAFECDKKSKLLNSNNDATANEEKFSINSMACRRAYVSNIIVKPSNGDTKDDQNKTVPSNESNGINNPNPNIPIKPTSSTDTINRRRQSIGKKLLRKLLTECDYFDVLEKENPFIYSSLKEKIKYFNPAFHSMTPEGLNARLTFLNQCVRPGDTIPVIGPDNRPVYNDAVNTSFGTPPILVLRVGDYYHTKIVPNQLKFSYEQLYDMNPEGIGVQPMIVTVSLGFDFIGGHGLAKPIDELQNALSFNYYANTEIYDERATATEDTSAVDNALFKAIFDKEVASQPGQTQLEKRGGKTIGDISTTVPVTGGETGFTTYQKIMDSTMEETKKYFTEYLNFVEKIFTQNNYGIWNIISFKGSLDYSKGKLLPPSESEITIFGKPKEYDKKIQELFEEVYSDIRAQKNYIIKYMDDNKRFKDTDIIQLSINMEKAVTEIANDFLTDLSTNINNFVQFQENLVQNFRKIFLVSEKTDGKILSKGTPFVYTIIPTDQVYTNTTETSKPTDTLVELENDSKILVGKYNEYNKLLANDKYIIINDNTKFPEDFNFRLYTDKDSFKQKEDKRFFMVTSQVFSNKNKLQEFKTKLLKNGLSEVSKFEKFLDKACDKFAGIVEDELKAESKVIKEIKKDKIFIDLTKKDAYPKGKTRKFSYTTVDTTDTQKDKVKELWSNNNTGEVSTWEGKIKFK